MEEALPLPGGFDIKEELVMTRPYRPPTPASDLTTWTHHELRAEIERLRTPICVGKTIIQILARDGTWQSENGNGVIAADELFHKDPYAEIERLRELFRIDGEQHAIHVREIEARHELRHKHYCAEIERLRAALAVERERCATVALEQRCERGTPWDLACTTIAAAVRREK